MGIASPSTIHTTLPDEISSVSFGISPSPLGKILIARSPLGIAHLSFIEGSESARIRSLRAELPKARLTRNDMLAEKLVHRVFQTAPEVDLHLWGTDFQLKTWKALLDIPFGRTSTYGQIARNLHVPGSARAVGNAIGRNRIAYLIPCHRITRQNGSLGGYRWGDRCKIKLLEWEKRFHTGSNPLANPVSEL